MATITGVKLTRHSMYFEATASFLTALRIRGTINAQVYDPCGDLPPVDPPTTTRTGFQLRLTDVHHCDFPARTRGESFPQPAKVIVASHARNRIDCAKIHKFDARCQSLPCALVDRG
jgi:hypothetical protein